MAYFPPRLQIQQDFQAVPVFSEKPLSALIFGPHYNLVRYGVAAEKALAAVVNPDGTSGNSYDAENDVAYPYPSRPVNTIVDTDYTAVYFDQVAAQYFPLAPLGSGPDAVAKVAIPNSSSYYGNRVRSSSLIFKTENGYNRSSLFSNRDVQVGDVITISDGSETLTSKVTGFVADVSAAALSAVTNVDGNKETASEDYNDAVVGTYVNVTVANASTSYDGYPELGVVEDTYTATVTTAGNLSAVRFSITSANSVFATKTNQALVTGDVLEVDASIDGDLVRDVLFDFTGSTAFLVGQTFALSVVAAVTQVTPTVTGTYTGPKDLTYTGVIVRGGPAFDGSNGSTCAQIRFTSTDTDTSGPTNLATATATAVGSYGVTMAFAAATSNGAFILGDQYQVTATAAAPAQVRTILFKDTLTSGLLAAGALTLTLAEYRNGVSIPAVRDTIGNLNWVSAADAVTINEGIYLTNASLVATDASLAELPVVSAKVYVTHRDLLRTQSGSIKVISNASTVSSVLGPITPDNPLAQGVYNALLNSGSVAAYYSAVPTNDLAGYNSVLNLAGKTNKVYGLTPLTFDTDVQTAVVAHVNTYSTPINAKWRVTWLSKPLVTTSGIYTTVDGENYEATVSVDTTVSGTQYTVFTVPTAQFITDGVRAGDVVRYNYSTDSSGAIVYDTYLVSEIRSETILVVDTSLSGAVVVGKKFELWREFSKDEQATNYAATSGSDNRRVRVVFPSKASLGGVEQDGYFVAAALAGLRSGVAPHEGLTNIQLAGFDDFSEVLEFSDEQLNTIAEAGVWIVTQEAVGAAPYTRHQLTTDMSSTKTAEDQFTSNTDSISYGLQSKLEPYIGKYNITPESRVLIYGTIDSELRYRQTNTFTTRGGNQLLGYTITKFEQNQTFRDRLDIAITLVEPYPFNYGDIILSV